LQPMRLSEEKLEEIRKRMPPLPNALFARFVSEYQLPDYDARLLTEEKHLALYFNALCQETKFFKAASNWMMGPVKSFLNERALEILEFPLQPKQLAGIIDLVESGKVAFSNASTHIFPLLCETPSKNPESIAQELKLIQNSDSDSLEPIVLKVLEAWPDKVAEYRSGKTGLLGLFVGEVMKASKGQADPKVTNQLVKKHLDA
jgi:aspartyl-tRNA(Asn)/glutamyl-tRNA(Gln) amidotransferase subunit B